MIARMNDPKEAAEFVERKARNDPGQLTAYVAEILSSEFRPEPAGLPPPLPAFAAPDA